MANQEPLETLKAEQVRERFQTVLALKEAPYCSGELNKSVRPQREIILSLPGFG